MSILFGKLFWAGSKQHLSYSSRHRYLPHLARQWIPLHHVTQTVLADYVGIQSEHGWHERESGANLAIRIAKVTIANIQISFIGYIQTNLHAGGIGRQQRISREFREIEAIDIFREAKIAGGTVTTLGRRPM